jgi:acetyl esterase/lipase
MAIPLQTQLFWRVYSRVGGRSIMQLPAEEIRAASDRRKWLVGVPLSNVVTGRAHPNVLTTQKTAGGVSVRVYRPADSVSEVLPIVMNFHGGGFVSGDPRQSEWWCSSIAQEVRAVVVSVDYRLAPEHPFPAAPDDCYAATVWAAENASDLGADGTRLAVMGDSAGGNLAAVICLMARDRGGPPIAFQLLIYPMVDMIGDYPSEDENEFAPILGKADLHVHEVYCLGGDSARADPYASPLFGKHEGLPPALIQTAEHDPLRDQGPAYAAALEAAGVPAQVRNYVDAVHGYISVPGIVPAARQALADAAAALRAALSESPDFREQKALE